MNSSQRSPAGRHSIRLKGYDYSRNGAYFITIVAQHRAPRFGRVVRGRMLLSEAGSMVHSVIANLDSLHPRVHIEVFQVMPDHIHAIVVLRRVSATTPTTGYDASRCDEPRATTPTMGSDASHGDESVGAGPRACPGHPGCADPPKSPRCGVSQSSDRDAWDRCCASCMRWCWTGDGATRRRDGISLISSRGQARGPAPTRSSPRDASYPVVGVVARETSPREIALPDVVQHIKSLTTARYRHAVTDHGWARFRGRLWQRNYYERIIRDERALANIRRYIRANPRNWIEPPRWR